MDARDCGVVLLSFALRFAVFNLDFITMRPELNSPTNSFLRLTEERYAPNQSVIPKALYSMVQQDLRY